MLTIGIYGATGYMGAPYTRALLQAHRANQLHLILLHRPASNLARYPADDVVEKRCIDLEHGDIGTIRGQLQDLQVVICAVSWQAHTSQYRLIDALAGSEALVTFFPSEYATPHRAEDLGSPFFRGNSAEKAKVRAYCEEKGVPCTRLANATVPELVFNFGDAPAFDIRQNKLELYHPLGTGKRGLTSRKFSGQALVHLVLHRLSDLPNAVFSLVELPFSAQDVIDVSTKLHDGQEPTIVEYTEEQYQRDLHSSFFSAMGAASKKGLAVGVEWPGEVVSGENLPGWELEGKTLEAYVREGMEGQMLTFKTLRNRGVMDLSKDHD